MVETRCRYGRHEIRTPRDRRSSGECAACARDRESRYRKRRNVQLISDELAQMRSIAAQLVNRGNGGDRNIADALNNIADAFTSRLHPGG